MGRSLQLGWGGTSRLVASYVIASAMLVVAISVVRVFT
jgi:hypothetical protein